MTKRIKQYRPNRKKCRVQRKTMYDTEQEASYAMFRTWSHDPSVNMLDMHTYKCDKCGKFHFGHVSYYQKYLNRQTMQQPPA